MDTNYTPARFSQRYADKNIWYELNPILAEGEIGIESDTGFFKIGDGKIDAIEAGSCQQTDGLQIAQLCVHRRCGHGEFHKKSPFFLFSIQPAAGKCKPQGRLFQADDAKCVVC
jgi:hypothetical protein